MNREAILEWVNRWPFEPFVLRLSNGERHEVRHPETVIVTKSKMVVAYPEIDRVVFCSLIHVNSIEGLQPA